LTILYVALLKGRHQLLESAIMLTLLRMAGVACLALGAVGLVAAAGIPFMGGGNTGLLWVALAVFGLGWILLIAHAVLHVEQCGWAAAGLTVPGLALLGAAAIGSWWFLAGPRANAYPRIYGIGILLVALIIASLVLPRLPRD
jgi:hypothetical protein